MTESISVINHSEKFGCTYTNIKRQIRTIDGQSYVKYKNKLYKAVYVKYRSADGGYWKIDTGCVYVKKERPNNDKTAEVPRH